MAIPIYVIIVTHNSAEVLDLCLAHLANQTAPIRAVAIVDSGSDDPGYLDAASGLSGMRIIRTANVGFSKANNIGFEAIVADPEGMVVFINPDTFLPPDYLALAVTVLNENPGAAVVSGKLLGFDRKAMRPSGKIDSTGIFRRWTPCKSGWSRKMRPAWLRPNRPPGTSPRDPPRRALPVTADAVPWHDAPVLRSTGRERRLRRRSECREILAPLRVDQLGARQVGLVHRFDVRVIPGGQRDRRQHCFCVSHRFPCSGPASGRIHVFRPGKWAR